ncbi:MAG: hypothetical protein AAGB24_03230 [Bacteroidota bacterium]
MKKPLLKGLSLSIEQYLGIYSAELQDPKRELSIKSRIGLRKIWDEKVKQNS